MNDYKPLLSSAPPHSILNAQAFRYTNSAATDIRKTFERVWRARANANERQGISSACISFLRERDAV